MYRVMLGLAQQNQILLHSTAKVERIGVVALIRLAGRVRGVRRAVAAVDVKVCLACREALRVLGHPAGDDWVVPAVEIVLLARSLVNWPTSPTDQAALRWIAFADDLSEAVADDMVNNARNACDGVPLGKITDRPLPISERPKHFIAYDAAAVQVRPFVGHQLIHGVGLPEVAVRKTGTRHRTTAVLLELQDDLVAVVGEADLMLRAIGVDVLANPPVLDIIQVIHNLRRIAAEDRPVGDFGQAIPVIPGVLRDVRVAGVEHAVVVGVDELGGPVAFGIIRVRVGAVRNQPIVSAGYVGAAVGRLAVAVGVIGIRLVRLPAGVACGDELPGRVVSTTAQVPPPVSV